MKTKQRKKGRGSSKAGRPRKEGARYADGRLRPPGPNQIIVQGRKAMLGDDKLDIATASDPLDFALAKGWLTDAEHKAARTLGKVYRQSGIGGPRMNPAGLHEVQPALQIDARSFASMSDAELMKIWETVFHDEGDEGQAEPREQRAHAALALWGKIMAALPKDVQTEVFSVCIGVSWPQWMVLQSRGKDLTAGMQSRKDRLLIGLRLIRQVTRKPRPEPAPVAPVAHPVRTPSRGPMLEERFTYVTPTGETVLEVVRKRRRAS